MVMSAIENNKARERKGCANAFTSIVKRVTFEQNLEDRKGANLVDPGGRTFQAEGTGNAEAWGGSMLEELGEGKAWGQGEVDELREETGGVGCAGQCRPWWGCWHWPGVRWKPVEGNAGETFYQSLCYCAINTEYGQGQRRGNQHTFQVSSGGAWTNVGAGRWWQWAWMLGVSSG